jgi:hypothetical protein
MNEGAPDNAKGLIFLPLGISFLKICYDTIKHLKNPTDIKKDPDVFFGQHKP